MANTAVFVGSNLTGSSRKYSYEVKISGSSYYDETSGRVITDISYSIQAINKHTGQPCPLRPYSASSVDSIELALDQPVTEYTIDIGSDKVIHISTV